MKPLHVAAANRTVQERADNSSCGNLLEDSEHHVESHALPAIKSCEIAPLCMHGGRGVSDS